MHILIWAVVGHIQDNFPMSWAHNIQLCGSVCLFMYVMVLIELRLKIPANNISVRSGLLPRRTREGVNKAEWDRLKGPNTTQNGVTSSSYCNLHKHEKCSVWFADATEKRNCSKLRQLYHYYMAKYANQRDITLHDL